MPKNETSENLSFALEACAYSRSQILEGTTQLQNNFYDISKKSALGQALNDLRNAFVKEAFFLNIENSITRFEKNIADCKKFSIGNCHELALMALDFMIRNKPEVNAETYSIKGGDHVFLVIGRNKDSDPLKPETWGDDCYICDPWSDSVYPAKEYLVKTKNFYFTLNSDGTHTNHIQDFNPSRHQMNPIPSQNSTNIIQGSRQLNTIILDIFTTINEKHCVIFNKLADDLDKIANRLIKKYGAEDPKVKIIKEKIDIIRSETSKLRAEFTEYAQSIKSDLTSEKYQSHKEINDNLQKMMRGQMKILRQSSSLSKEESEHLNKYKNEDSLLTMIMKFLHIAPSSSREYKAALTKTEDKISDFSKLVNNTYGR